MKVFDKQVLLKKHLNINNDFMQLGGQRLNVNNFINME